MKRYCYDLHDGTLCEAENGEYVKLEDYARDMREMTQFIVKQARVIAELKPKKQVQEAIKVGRRCGKSNVVDNFITSHLDYKIETLTDQVEVARAFLKASYEKRRELEKELVEYKEALEWFADNKLHLTPYSNGYFVHRGNFHYIGGGKTPLEAIQAAQRGEV